jgi:hypothetical protein
MTSFASRGSWVPNPLSSTQRASRSAESMFTFEPALLRGGRRAGPGQTRPAMVSAETSGAIAYGVSNVWAGRA